MNHGGAEARSEREGQTFGGESLLVRYVNFVKLPHTLFALPFALLGVLAASRVAAVGWQTVLWVVLAFSAFLSSTRLEGRAFGWAIHPNQLGHSCMMGCAASAWLYDNATSRLQRWCWAGAAAVSIRLRAQPREERARPAPRSGSVGTASLASSLARSAGRSHSPESAG